MIGAPVISEIPAEKILANKECGLAVYGPWAHFIVSKHSETITVARSENPPLGFPLFHTKQCYSTMDLAWLLHDRNDFPDWSAVLSDYQLNGRGQFKRQWVSQSGNLYVSFRFPEKNNLTSAAPLITALAINRALQQLNIHSEYKWPNDILVHGKKMGGILVEERSGAMIVGIGLNLVQSPTLDDMRDPRSLSAGHLSESGLSIAPLKIWPVIAQTIKKLSDVYAGGNNHEEMIKSLENIMAFSGENVVFKPLDGMEFSAVISGLSETGGIRLKTTDGEKIFLSGSFTPVIH
jgi:BirA family biotin operon repressor/biotin-[acetyl-CoA-carboxylase] ligase